jgi:hypothetical protein
MVAWLLPLLLAAPASEASQMLKVAYASQYEWKEDDVKSVLMDFRYKLVRKEGKNVRSYEGTGQMVVVGETIERRHFQGASWRENVDLTRHLDWIHDRFVRKPFDEQFKGIKLSGPEKIAGGFLKVAAGRNEFLLKEDRIHAMNVARPPRNKNEPVRRTRYSFKLAEVRDGYAIVGQEAYYKDAKDVRLGGTRTLELGERDEIPVPKIYRATYRNRPKETNTLEIDFVQVRVNADDPVVLDKEARDLLKAAWERRYVLPKEIRVMGSFRRRLLGDAPRWLTDDVQGEFQVWGMDDIQAKLDDRFHRDTRADRRRELEKVISERIPWVYGVLQPTPFEVEFKGCGFRLEEAKKGVRIDVLGYGKALAFLLNEDRFAAHLIYGSDENAWWTYKIKETRDGNILQSMTREIDGEKYTQKITYSKVKGYQVPKRFTYLRFGGNRGKPYLAEWSFKKTRVEMPKKK